jgi:tetratricopeptide (TPR) repeat protein
MQQKAVVAEQDGEYDKALRLYDRLTRVAPGYPYAWSNKANAHVARGELDQALDSYVRSLEVRYVCR